MIRLLLMTMMLLLMFRRWSFFSPVCWRLGFSQKEEHKKISPLRSSFFSFFSLPSSSNYYFGSCFSFFLFSFLFLLTLLFLWISCMSDFCCPKILIRSSKKRERGTWTHQSPSSGWDERRSCFCPHKMNLLSTKTEAGKMKRHHIRIHSFEFMSPQKKEKWNLRVFHTKRHMIVIFTFTLIQHQSVCEKVI